MKKIIVIFLFLFFTFPSNLSASILKIEPNGEILATVLGESDEITLEIPSSKLEIQEIAEVDNDQDSIISLKNQKENTVINVSTQSGNKVYDIKGDKDLIEIQERPDLEKIIISSSKDGFLFNQKGFVVWTDYEIEIDPVYARLSVKAPSGSRYVAVFPRQAVLTLLRAKIVNRVGTQEIAQLREVPGGDLAYVIKGEKIINLFDFFEYSVPVTSKVSALTGEVMEIDQPAWLKFLGFLFV